MGRITKEHAEIILRNQRYRDAWEVCWDCGDTYHPYRDLVLGKCLKCVEKAEAEQEE